MSTHEYDVAIVGYGPVGVTAANLLGQRGLRVLVAEKDPSLYSRARAMSTDEEILRIWQRIGLADRLQDNMLSEMPIDFVDRRGRSILGLTPRRRGNGYPPQSFIHQPALEGVLRDGVQRFANVTVCLDTEVVDHQQDVDGVALTLRELAAATSRRARARYVIAADGGSSPTRSRLGIGFDGRTYEDRWVVIDTKVRQTWPEVDRLRFHCDPARPSVDCPAPLGHHRWEFPVLADDDEEELVTAGAVRRLLSDQGIGPDNVEVLRAVVYSHHVRFASRWRAGRVFLAGDAAHVMPPWIGQGMASGIRDVHNLCWKLAGVLDGTLPDEALDTYETERMPHVRALTSAAVNFGRIITERRPALTALRDPLLRTVGSAPLVGRYLRQGDWFPDTQYRRGLLARSRPRLARRERKAIGRMIPQPWVQTGDEGRKVRLDDALGSGWAVLSLGGDPSAFATWHRQGVPCWPVHPTGAASHDGALVDVDGVLTAWMRAHGADVLAVRPDGIVYAAAGRHQVLSASPLLKAVGVRRGT